MTFLFARKARAAAPRLNIGRLRKWGGFMAVQPLTRSFVERHRFRCPASPRMRLSFASVAAGGRGEIMRSANVRATRRVRRCAGN
jgi:hypothetical protein